LVAPAGSVSPGALWNGDLFWMIALISPEGTSSFFVDDNFFGPNSLPEILIASFEVEARDLLVQI